MPAHRPGRLSASARNETLNRDSKRPSNRWRPQGPCSRPELWRRPRWQQPPPPPSPPQQQQRHMSMASPVRRQQPPIRALALTLALFLVTAGPHHALRAFRFRQRPLVRQMARAGPPGQKGRAGPPKNPAEPNAAKEATRPRIKKYLACTITGTRARAVWMEIEMKMEIETEIEMRMEIERRSIKGPRPRQRPRPRVRKWTPQHES
jgi:hypothetical protein